MSTHQNFPTTPLARLGGHHGPVHVVTFSAGSGQYLLTGAQDRHIRLFNPGTQKLVQTYSAHGHEILDLSVSADNSRFASVGGDKTVFVWDVASAQTVRRFTGHSGRVEAVRFGGDADAVVVTGSFDGLVKVWDLRASGPGKAIASFGEAKDAVSSLGVVGAEIWAGSVDGRVRIYDLAAGKVDVDAIGASVTSVAPTKGGEAYLVSALNGKVRLMDRATGQCLQTFCDAEFANEAYRIRSVLGMAEAVAISGSENGRVFVWDVLTGKVLHRLWHRRDGGCDNERGTKRNVVAAVAWNQLRKMWASAGGDGEVVVWGMEE